MNKYDLSILIPARNEAYISRTVQDILDHKRGKTEIIVALDGQWADPGIPDHEDVTIIYVPQSIGQRAATNQACRLSQAKYVMKCDAHTSFDEGFDVKMMEKMQDDWTMTPLMRNLHAFDWVCEKCGDRHYQGPSEQFAKCDKCGGERKKEVMWIAKESPKSTSFRVDKTLHFQYWGDFKNRPEGQGEITDTFSLQGSCFMLTREKYWELDICEEEFGSWGQQGCEVALKTWLSGGRVVCNQTTWYAHMFRTQGGDFGFPYRQNGKQIDHARKYSKELFLEKKWPKAVHDFEWLLEKFKPVPEWHDEKVVNKVVKPKKGVVYYTHNIGDPLILEQCRKQLLKGMKAKHIVSVSAFPLDFGKNILIPHVPEMGFLNMFLRILVGLRESTADIIFFCEHDVLYHPSHFDFIPPEKDKYYYNTNVWRVRSNDGHALWVNDLKQLSGLVAYRETLIKHYEERIKKIIKSGFSLDQGFEPGTHGREARVDDLGSGSYQAKYPNIDIRHETNATASRWTKEEFRNQKYTEGWKEADYSDISGWNSKIEQNFMDFLSSL